MSSIPVPDEQTRYSSRRQDDVDVLAWPVFSQRALDLLRSAGEVLHPEAFLPGVAMEETAVLRVRVEELRRLVEISGELSDVLLSAFDARRRLRTCASCG
jgi:thioredoxin reductase (NADPH)